MSTRPQGRTRAAKFAAMAFLLAVSCGLTYHFHAKLHTAVLFTHFFYVPIILACLWWRGRGLVVPVFLAGLLIVSHHVWAPAGLGPNDYARAAMFVVIGFVVVVLAERIARRELALLEATERIEHLNAVLRGIRNVNQLVVTEKDPDRLLQGVCDNLTETRGYHNAWIARFDQAGKVMMAVEAALGEGFSPMAERLKAGRLAACARRALDESGVVVTEDPPSACADCPLAAGYAGRGAMTAALRHYGKTYGLLCVSMPRQFLAESEEQAFFQEVAGDIAFALYGAEREEQRRKADDALRDSERKHRTLLESLPQRIFSKDRHSVYVSCNENFARVLGITPEEVAGKTDYDFFPKELAEKYRADDRRVMESGQTETIEEVFIENGREVTVQTVKTPIRDARGNTVGILGIFWDITDRKRAEKDLREAQEKLVAEQRRAREHAEAELDKLRDELVRTTRLAAIGQVSATIAHDLRNPLGSIRNAVFYLKRKTTHDQPLLEEYLGIIDQETTRADAIISNLLSMAKAKAPNRQEVDFGQLLADVLARDPKAAQVRCRISLEPDPFTVHADLDQLRQVVQNLLDNAADTMDGQGELFVEGQRHDEFDTITIRDVGAGVAPEVRDTLFEPLVTTKARGTGLGLTICRQMVERHGGTIDLIDQDAGGAAFRIRLPRLERQPPS